MVPGAIWIQDMAQTTDHVLAHSLALKWPHHSGQNRLGRYPPGGYPLGGYPPGRHHPRGYPPGGYPLMSMAMAMAVAMATASAQADAMVECAQGQRIHSNPGFRKTPKESHKSGVLDTLSESPQNSNKNTFKTSPGSMFQTCFPQVKEFTPSSAQRTRGVGKPSRDLVLSLN